MYPVYYMGDLICLVNKKCDSLLIISHFIPGGIGAELYKGLVKIGMGEQAYIFISSMN